MLLAAPQFAAGDQRAAMGAAGGAVGHSIKLNGEERLQSISKHEACSDKIVPITIARTKNHYGEWSEACKTGGETYSRFEIAGYLTESILVGTLAQRLDQQKILWDGPNAKCTNLAAANEFVNRKYRTGW